MRRNRHPLPHALRRLGLVLLLAAVSLPAASAATEPLKLASYRESTQLSLGTLAVEILPARSVRLKSPASGLLCLSLPERPGAVIAAGTLWGEFDPERTKLEREALALARTLLEKKQLPTAELDAAREAAELAERRSELARQTRMLRRIAAEPELSELYLDSASTTAAQREELTTLVTRQEEQLALIDKVLAFAGSGEHLRLEARSLELKLIQLEFDFEQRLADKRLVMPFDGELTLLPRRPAGEQTLRMQLGEELALIQDFSTIRARLVMKRPEWRLISPDKLHLRVAAGTKPLVARFERSLLEEVNGREELVYYFAFAEADRASARALVGGGLNARLLADLPGPARIVPKLDLVLAAPDAFREGDWDAGLAIALPGRRLVAIGETELAISTAP